MYGEKLSELDTYMKWEMSIYFGIKNPFLTAEAKWKKSASAFIKKLVHFPPPLCLEDLKHFF